MTGTHYEVQDVSKPNTGSKATTSSLPRHPQSRHRPHFHSLALHLFTLIIFISIHGRNGCTGPPAGTVCRTAVRSWTGSNQPRRSPGFDIPNGKLDRLGDLGCAESDACSDEDGDASKNVQWIYGLFHKPGDDGKRSAKNEDVDDLEEESNWSEYRKEERERV